MHLSTNEIDVSFQYRYANQASAKSMQMWNNSLIFPFQYPKAIRLIAGGLINIKPLVTHRFPLEEAVAAFYVAADPAQGAIKVQIWD